MNKIQIPRSEESATQAANTNRGITPGHRFENSPFERFTNPGNPVPQWGEEGVVIQQSGSQHRVSHVTASTPPLRSLVPRRRCDMSSPGKQVLIVDNDEAECAETRLHAGKCRSTTPPRRGADWRHWNLRSRDFDLVLVSSYLPDLYVGDFFARFNQLPVPPCSIVMQEGEGRAAYS